MGKKGYNWKARQSFDTKVDDSETQKVLDDLSYLKCYISNENRMIYYSLAVCFCCEIKPQKCLKHIEIFIEFSSHSCLG